jgi:hypothetical protein
MKSFYAGGGDDRMGMDDCGETKYSGGLEK